MNPTVSVLLPVYNGAAYLRESLESVLQQTYTDFELIVIDDGSRDDSAGIIQSIHDSRIRFYRQENRGLAATLNRAIELASGEYLARQDQDDVSFPQRFEKQVSHLAAHPQCALVGTWAEIIVGTQKTARSHRHAADNHKLKFDLLFDNPFVHSSVMLRSSAVRAVGMYSTDAARQPPEDYELWSRLARTWEVGNIPEILHVYREIPTSMSRDGVSPFRDHVINISIENLQWLLGGPSGDTAIQDLSALNHGVYARVSPQARWRTLCGLMADAVDKLTVVCGGHRAALERRGQAQLARIQPHFHRFRSGRGIRRQVRKISVAWERIVAGWR